MALSGKSGVSGGIDIRGTAVGEGVYTATTTAAQQALLNQGAVQYGKLVVSAAISAGSASLPANAYLEKIIVTERGGNAITGGLQFGVAAAGGTVCSAHAVGANANTVVTDAALLLKFFSVAAAQAIHYDAVTAWNGANVNIVITYGQL